MEILGGVGANVPAAILFQTTVNAVATTSLCLIAALTAMDVGTYEINDVVAQTVVNMTRYLEQ